MVATVLSHEAVGFHISGYFDWIHVLFSFLFIFLQTLILWWLVADWFTIDNHNVSTTKAFPHTSHPILSYVIDLHRRQLNNSRTSHHQPLVL